MGNFSFNKGNSISINGRTIVVGNGRSVNIKNNEVFIDGRPADLSEFGDAKVFNIVINGNVDSIDGEFSSVVVQGNAGTVKTMSGDVTVEGDTQGSISTMSGDVKVKGSIAGGVKTMSGDIRR